MRNDITHLPKHIRMDLEYITTFLLGQTHEIHLRLQNGARIRYIVLHGCFTEDHWQPDTELRPAEVSYRYNLMVIISKNLPEIYARLQEAVNLLNQSDKVSFPVSIQVDTHGRINRKLEDGYLAYDQIQTRGIRLYRRGHAKHTLFIQPKLPSVEKHYIQARNHFDHSFPLAQSFLYGARFFQDKKDRNAAAFMLNLAAVQAYVAFMVVHVLKYSDRRRVHELRELAESIHPELNIIWSGSRAEPCFDLLSTAFGGVRFGMDYKITDNELGLMFSHVEDLHNLVYYICQLKFEELKAGSLARPDKDWVEIISEGLKKPEAVMPKDEKEVESGPTETPAIETSGDEAPKDETEPAKVIETPDTKTTISDPSPIHRTAGQEKALEKLRTKIFELEEPYYELEQLGRVLKSMAHGDDDVELSGIFVMGRVVHERAHMIKDIFIQMVGLLKEIRIRGDGPIEEKDTGD